MDNNVYRLLSMGLIQNVKKKNPSQRVKLSDDREITR